MTDKMKEAYGLVSLYLRLYEKKYGKKLLLNKYKEKWAMADVIDSVGLDRAKEILEYYFTVKRVGHPLTWFYYNFERLDQIMNELAEDEKLRERLRQQTKLRNEEYEARKVKNEY